MADINININIERRIFLVIIFLFFLFFRKGYLSRKFSNTQNTNIINNSVLSH